MKKSFLHYFLISLLCLCTTTCFAANTREKINQLQEQIQSLKSNLKNDQNKRETLEEQLKQAEVKMGRLKSQTTRTAQQIKIEAKQLTQLKLQQVELQKQYQQQRNTLALLLRSAYLSGQNEYFKMILNLQDPNKISRLSAYHQYLVANRLDLLEQIKTSLAQLTEKETQIAENTEKLDELQKHYQQEQDKWENLAEQRQDLLQNMNTKINNKQEKLNNLLASKQALERVMQQISARSYPTPSGTFVTFNVRPGQLPWPTQGQVTESFGSGQSQLHLNGVVIAAAEGQPVYAIAPGRIVYSDWLVGYGLLIIVDHGSGFMSLYGRNAAVNKKAGDRVKTGDMIAQVGNSGGYANSGLYFAIRQNGKPVNPALWCGHKKVNSQPRRV